MTITEFDSPCDSRVYCSDCPKHLSPAKVRITAGSKSMNLCVEHSAELVRELEQVFLVSHTLRQQDEERNAR